MKVKDVMNPNVVFCKPDDTVREAARILKENNISGAPVIEDGELVGIVSEVDLLELLVIPERGNLWLPSPFEVIEVPIRELLSWEETKKMLSDVGTTRIEEMMTKEVHTISSESSVEEASELMVRYRINRLPVMENDLVVGIVTRGDIIEGLAKLESRRVFLKQIEGGICAVKGVSASGIKAGKMGIAVIHAEGPAAGVFTKNRVTAAPVILSKRVIETQHRLSAVIVNSGNANAFTGDDGFLDAMEMASALSEKLGIDAKTVAVASTGVIGRKLDVSWIREHLPEVIDGLGSSPGCSSSAAKAIMTTDTVLKEAAVELDCGVRIGAIAKGSGMIEPNMGTMLCFAYTDAKVPADVLDAALRRAVDKTFNMVVVDGDTSTSDMVLFTSTCKSGFKPCLECLDEFEKGLICVFTELAKKIARDGEGATKLIEARVTGAKTYEDAKLAAKAIVRSPLVKSAIFGKDPNWGRVVAAAGYSGAELEQERLSLSFSGGEDEVELVKSGEISIASDLSLLKKIMANEEIIINLNLGMGGESATAWGCDLTYDYVRINAEYTT